MIQRPISSGFLLFALIYFLIVPAIYTEFGLNNAGYIPNGHPG